MEKNKLSILIPDGESSLALSVLYCLSQISNLRVNILSSEPWTRIRFSRHRTGYHSYGKQLLDDGKLEVICDYVKKTKVDIVLPVDQPMIKLLAVRGEAVTRLAAISPIPNQEMFETVADKWQFANFLAKNNIPSPVTIIYRDDAGFEQDILNLSYPVLIKPTHGSGGKGIKLFSTISELKLHLEKEQKDGKLIVQSFINGYDIDCSVLCKDGKVLAYTIQKGFIPSKDAFGPPAGVEFLDHDQVYDVVQRLMKTLNWSGVAHIDLRYDEDDGQPKIIEINPRYWGSLIGSLIAGVNFPYLSCLATMDTDFPVPKYQYKRYVNIKARVGLHRQRILQRNDQVNAWIGETGIQYILKDPLPEIYKYFFERKRSRSI